MRFSDIQKKWLAKRLVELDDNEAMRMTQIIHKKGTDCMELDCHGECLPANELYKLYRKEPAEYRAITNFESWLDQIGIKQSYIEECKRTLDRVEVNEIVIGKEYTKADFDKLSHSELTSMYDAEMSKLSTTQKISYYHWLQSKFNLQTDAVNHPPHYQSEIIRCGECQSKIECIEVTRHMNFNLGNAIKYIWRCESKGKQIEDLKKAVWYLNDEIRKLEK